MEFRIQYGPHIDYKVNSIWDTFYYFNNFFKDEYIDRLDKLIKENYTFSKGKTGSTELGMDTDSYKTNNRNIAYIDWNKKTEWLYELLFPLSLQANDEIFNFDIDYVTDPLHYVIYPENGGHLTWHTDISKFSMNRRKLAMTVQLSSPDDYSGGEFEIWNGEKFEEVPRQKGDIIVFPTFLMHRVKPVTKGKRKCLVFWTGVRPFR